MTQRRKALTITLEGANARAAVINFAAQMPKDVAAAALDWAEASR
jgi:hypothetical protein